MSRNFIKIFSLLLIFSLFVSPVIAGSNTREIQSSEGPTISLGDQAWLEMAESAESFTVQLQEPSLAAVSSEKTGFISLDGSDGILTSKCTTSLPGGVFRSKA